MVHPLVEQLRFTRSEWQRALEGVSADEAAQRFESINPIAWMVGHLAWHEQLYWLDRAQGKIIAENVLPCGFGQPASNPPLDDMWDAWHTIMQASEAYLDTLTSEKFLEYFIVDGKPHYESIGTMMRRITYHYWFHLGESQAIRQMLGHKNLPGFVGNINSAAYRVE